MLRPRETGGEQDLASFWRGVGERRGGEVAWYSFATFVGRAGGGAALLAGLLYRVGDRFWFEDFERDNWLLRILPPRRPFAKTEVLFDRTAVAVVPGRLPRHGLPLPARGDRPGGDARARPRRRGSSPPPSCRSTLADGERALLRGHARAEFLAELGMTLGAGAWRAAPHLPLLQHARGLRVDHLGHRAVERITRARQAGAAPRR